MNGKIVRCRETLSFDEEELEIIERR